MEVFIKGGFNKMAITYSMVSNTNNMAFRSGAGSQYPLVLNSGNPKIVNGYVQRLITMTGANLISVGTTDKWLHVTAVNGQACDGYVAQKIGTTTYCVLTEINTPDPVLKQEILYVSIIPHYSDGTAGVSEDYYPVLV
jgi:hypothetical protein